MTRTLCIVLLSASIVAAFIAGAALGRKGAFADFVAQTKTWDARVNFGRYVVYRDIAVALKSGRYDDAECNADVLASSWFDDERRCMADSVCRPVLEKEKGAQSLAPEVFGHASVPFDYVANIDTKSCRR